MQRFYEVVYVWSDGDKVTDAIYADSLDEAIDKIVESAIKTEELKEDKEDEDCIVEIQFWNDDEEAIFCSVTEDRIFISDTIPEYPQWID